jgi:DNA-binding NarL/FixJ family response regulator
MTSVVVADDHPVFRKGLITLLRACNFEVVGEAGSGNEAIEVVSRERPDIVLMDLGLPDMGGVMAPQHITAANPKVQVVAITLDDDEESVRNALEAGASGYIVKDANPDQIIAAWGGCIGSTLAGQRRAASWSTGLEGRPNPSWSHQARGGCCRPHRKGPDESNDR